LFLMIDDDDCSRREVANAMSLAMSLGGLGGEKGKKAALQAAQASLGQPSAGDVEAALSLVREMAENQEPSQETLRLFRKAMKQRRGSVDNIAETLMGALAAGGEDVESVAKAMVKALRATGASPDEIAALMGQALDRNGVPREEAARLLASAMAEAGASSE